MAIHKNGYSKARLKYDNNGISNKTIYLDLNGNPVPTQIIIDKILPNSQAEQVGLKAGDVITDYNGISGTISEVMYEINRIAQNASLNEQIFLNIMRDGKRLTMKLVPGNIGIHFSDVFQN